MRPSSRSHSASGFRRLYLLALSALASFGTQAQSDVDETRAAQIKAAYLRHLAGYAEWPNGTFETLRHPIVIAIVGKDPNGVGPLLAQAVEERMLSAGGRELKVKLLPAPPPPGKPLPPCHLIFLTENAVLNWKDWKNALAGRPVLTVSEKQGFAKEGGMVEFTMMPGSARRVSIRLAINVEASAKARLKISSRLLGLPGVKLVKP